MTFRPKLRSVLVAVSLLVFVIPLGAVFGLRIYESELIRRTEAELISQGALIQAAFKRHLHELVEEQNSKFTQIPDKEHVFEEYGKYVEVKWPNKVKKWLKPVPKTLELTTTFIQSPAPPPEKTDKTPSPLAKRVGQRLQYMLVDSSRITLSGIRVVDPNGIVISSTDSSTGASLINRPEVQRALNGEFVQILRRRPSDAPEPPLSSISRGTDFSVYVTMPIVERDRLLGAVVLSRTPMSLMKALYKHRYFWGTLLGFMLMGVVGISLMTSYFIGRPIQRLIEQTRGIQEGHKDAEPIDKPGTQEVRELSEAFAEMARTVQQRAEYIESFARSVSHEFKTPLSSIQGTVELLQQHWDSMSIDKRQKFLDNLESDSQRLEKLVNRLLDLARADVHDPGDSSTRLDRQLEDIAKQHSTEHFEVTLTSRTEHTRAAVSEQVVDTVLSNLLSNARKHGGTRVEIELRSDPNSEQTGSGFIEVYVRDNGPGVSSHNADKIFDSFFTTADDEGGTGLGLAIVQSLVQAHEGDIELTDYDDGAEFRLQLPLANPKQP